MEGEGLHKEERRQVKKLLLVLRYATIAVEGINITLKAELTGFVGRISLLE